jgi:restriction endonuclease Mrr
MRKIIALIGFCSIITTSLAQQKNADSAMIVRKVFMDGDTFYVYSFDEFILKEFNSKEEKENYLKLVRNVKRVMPYAKLAAFRLQMMEDNLNQLTSERAKKKYIKATEEAIKEEFLTTLKNLSVSQGKLLIKLIHRETGNTTFEILKKYRGSASTMFYGLWAKMYNADIDTKFDPIEDYQIEYIIKNAKLE